MDGQKLGARVVRFEGVLDLERARIMLELALDDGSDCVALDLSGAREIHDAAIALLVAATRAERLGLELRGLRDHHRKLFELLQPGAGGWRREGGALPN